MCLSWVARTLVSLSCRRERGDQQRGEREARLGRRRVGSLRHGRYASVDRLPTSMSRAWRRAGRRRAVRLHVCGLVRLRLAGPRAGSAAAGWRTVLLQSDEDGRAPTIGSPDSVLLAPEARYRASYSVLLAPEVRNLPAGALRSLTQGCRRLDQESQHQMRRSALPGAERSHVDTV